MTGDTTKKQATTDWTVRIPDEISDGEPRIVDRMAAIELGELNDLTVERVGLLKTDAAIRGGSREVVLFPQGGVLAINLLSRMNELGPDDVIEVIVTRAVGPLSRLQRAYLTVRDGRVYVTDNSDVDDVGEPEFESNQEDESSFSGVVPSEYKLLPGVYGGGLSGHPGSKSSWEQGLVRREVWWIGFDVDWVRIWRQHANAKRPGRLIREYAWNQIRTVSFEEGGTRSNVGALVTFGLLGLGARKELSVLTVTTEDETSSFVVHRALHRLRPLRDALVRLGVPEKKVPIGSDPERSDDSLDLAGQLSQLADLFRDGLISKEQFETAKDKLLDKG